MDSIRGQHHTWPSIARAAGMMLCLALAAPSCRVPAPAATTPVAVPKTFSATGTVAAPAQWWTAFGDKQLDALMARAVAGNLDLPAAWDRLAQAEATARRAGADLVPSLTGDASASRTRARTRPGGGASANRFALGLTASYEVDLWGRVRSTRDAAALAARASRDDVTATAITLTAQVATAWVRLVDQRGQLALLDGQIRTNAEYLELVTLRFRRGQVSAVDVLQQRQLLESTQAEKVQAEAARQVLEHQVAILLGQPPTAKAAPANGALPALPELPATGLPADLVQRRPDVRAAFLRLGAASQAVAAAVADRFPTVSLAATAETADTNVRDLFGNWLASLAANLAAPILDGGRRAAEVDRARAVAAERLHAYAQAILTSLQEVEDALVQEQRQREFLASLERQLDLASKSAAQTRDRYIKGAEDYLRVLTSLQSYQRLPRSVLAARRELIEFRIDLYRALGGGWELTRPAPPTAGDDGERNAR